MIELETQYLYKGSVVTVIDITLDNLRAYVTTENPCLFDKVFIPHQGWCDRLSGYVEISELMEMPHAVELADFTEQELSFIEKREIEEDDWIFDKSEKKVVPSLTARRPIGINWRDEKDWRDQVTELRNQI